MKIHFIGEFFKPPERQYKFVVLDYVYLIDCDMFSINELDGMLEELGLGDNNKILYTHFRIPDMSLDDGLVPLMADQDVIKLLNYVPECKEIKSKSVGNGVVIEKIVEDNVVTSSGRDQDWSELGKEEEHVDTSTHASTFDVCPVVESRNDENVGNLYCDNDVPMANAFSFRNVMKDSDVCLECDLLLDDWIMDSGYTKHMTGNRRLFTSYKACDGGYVVF
ncbi:hypothetical protein Tco_0933756 [Tanacetum coccineum]